MPRPRPSCICALVLAGCTPGVFGWQDERLATLHQYRQAFAAAAGERLVERIDRERLHRILSQTDTLWLGDHHRHAALHGLHLELLRELHAAGRPLAFGLEAIGVRDQPHVDDYLRAAIDMPTLRRRMRARWSGSWLDDRDLDPWYFRALLAFAREIGAPVFALEPTPRLPLPQRDTFMAQAIARAGDRWPGRLLVVVVGQTHLLGDGDLVRRSGRGGVPIGGLPTDRLRAAAPARRRPGALWRSDAGVWWFDELFARGTVSR